MRRLIKVGLSLNLIFIGAESHLFHPSLSIIIGSIISYALAYILAHLIKLEVSMREYTSTTTEVALTILKTLSLQALGVNKGLLIYRLNPN